MGMFDSFYDADGIEWQTKAFACNLDEYRVGDLIEGDGFDSFQVEILGGQRDHNADNRDSLATIRDGVLASIDDARDHTLPLLNYSGHLIAPATPKESHR